MALRAIVSISSEDVNIIATQNSSASNIFEEIDVNDVLETIVLLLKYIRKNQKNKRANNLADIDSERLKDILIPNPQPLLSMHLKFVKTLVFGALCACALSASAGTPPMSEYFSYKDPSTAGDPIVLDPLTVKGSRTVLKPVSEKLADALNRHLPTVSDKTMLASGLKLYLVTDLEEDFLSDTSVPASSDFVRKLKGGMRVNLPYTDTPMTVYIRSGLAWRIDYQWSFIAPYAKGRNLGIAFRYNMLK